MNEKEYRDFNENMAQKYGPDKYYQTKVRLIRLAEALKQKIICSSVKSIHSYGGYLLDVGCGTCEILKRCDFAKKVGMDFSSYLLKIAGKQAPDIDLVQGNGEHLPFKDDSFPCILLTDVIEHVPHPQAVADEIFRVARSDALLIVNIPNDRLINRCKKMLKSLHLDRFFVTEYHRQDNSSGNLEMQWHLQEFSLRDIKALFEPRWDIAKVRAIPHALFPFQHLLFLQPKK